MNTQPESGMVPAATDPNREKELQRLKQDPKSFGFGEPQPSGVAKDTIHLPKGGRK
jgi:hypothetical protein